MAFVPYIEEGGRYLPTYMFAWRSRQDKPYVDPLPYETFVRIENGCKVLYQTDANNVPDKGQIFDNAMWNVTAWTEGFHGFGNNGSVGESVKNQRVAAHNRALSKLSDKLSYVNNLFEAWYERKEAYTLLGQCLKSMRNLVLNWKKPKFWKTLMSTAGKKAKQPETLPEAWLLLQFAIRPLVGTIDDILHLLSQDFPETWEEGVSGARIPVLNYWVGYYDELYFETELYIVKHGVRVSGLNPNKQLLNIFGGTTPVSTYMDVIPWMWGVNYFINVNDYVSNFETRFPGIIVDKSYTTTLSKEKHFGGAVPGNWYPYTPVKGGNAVYPVPGPLYKFDGHSVHFKRTVSNSVPNYKLERKFPLLGSNQFANLSSAIALTMKGASKK